MVWSYIQPSYWFRPLRPRAPDTSRCWWPAPNAKVATRRQFTMSGIPATGVPFSLLAARLENAGRSAFTIRTDVTPSESLTKRGMSVSDIVVTSSERSTSPLRRRRSNWWPNIPKSARPRSHHDWPIRARRTPCRSPVRETRQSRRRATSWRLYRMSCGGRQNCHGDSRRCDYHRMREAQRPKRSRKNSTPANSGSRALVQSNNDVLFGRAYGIGARGSLMCLRQCVPISPGGMARSTGSSELPNRGAARGGHNPGW
jgi:hypothetical protein